MNSYLDIAARLADGEWHLGTEMGHALGISRSAVWKAIRYLQNLGLPITALPHKGYRLATPLELLNTDRIHALLEPRLASQLQSLYCVPQLDSTNQYLLEQVNHQVLGTHVCLTEHQANGRGRQGRRWVAPFGSGITLSLLWQFHALRYPIAGLSLAAAVAIVTALTQYGIPGLGLKWPNDILWQGRKLAGLLLEVTGEIHGCHGIVIGLGLNTDLSLYATTATATITQPWVDLRTLCGGPCQRNTVAALLINALITMLNDFQQHGLSYFLPQWRQWDALADHAISFQHGGQTHQGIARGITDAGALLLQQHDEIHTFFSGEVSLLRTMPPTHPCE